MAMERGQMGRPRSTCLFRERPPIGATANLPQRPTAVLPFRTLSAGGDGPERLRR